MAVDAAFSCFTAPSSPSVIVRDVRLASVLKASTIRACSSGRIREPLCHKAGALVSQSPSESVRLSEWPSAAVTASCSSLLLSWGPGWVAAAAATATAKSSSGVACSFARILCALLIHTSTSAESSSVKSSFSRPFTLISFLAYSSGLRDNPSTGRQSLLRWCNVSLRRFSRSSIKSLRYQRSR